MKKATTMEEQLYRELGCLGKWVCNIRRRLRHTFYIWYA